MKENEELREIIAKVRRAKSQEPRATFFIEIDIISNAVSFFGDHSCQEMRP